MDCFEGNPRDPFYDVFIRGIPRGQNHVEKLSSYTRPSCRAMRREESVLSGELESTSKC